ncbi:MAG TPA: hypothetical protein VEJ67_06430 [Candidatus Cybelea sp.]|nr:hypothetical protein [Candidatus Cybelea sp.]
MKTHRPIQQAWRIRRKAPQTPDTGSKSAYSRDMVINPRKILIFPIALVLALWAKFYFPGYMVDHDKTSHAHLIAEQEKAQPLIDALEKYRGDNGLYPTTLAALEGKYVSSSVEARAFIYSAYSSDQLPNGFRNYELQSENFPSNSSLFHIDRWAFYESAHEQWRLGWCSHGRRGSRTASNGVCR